MEEAKKAERARELEEKKARLEAYRTKRRLDKLPDKEEPAVAAAPATQVTAAAPAPNVEALLASVLAAPAANAVPEAAQPVAAPVTVEREAVAVALAVRRGAAGAEAAPREVETYVRTTQTDASAADERSESNQTPGSEVAPSPTPSVEETAEAAAAREVREAALKAEAERQAAAVAEAERRRWREDAGLAAAAERAGERTERWLRASEGSGRDPLWDPRRAAESGGAAGGGESAGAGEPVAILRPGDNELGAVAALAGSPHAAELCLAVHSGEEGCVALWGLDGVIEDRPLRRLGGEGRVARAVFVPWSPPLVLGAARGGALLLWDQRARSALPVLRSTSGHAHPVVSLLCLGSSHAQLVHSVSSDGRQCSWSLALLSAPASTAELRAATVGGGPALAAVAPSCASFAPHETDAFILGTEAGQLVQGSRGASADEDLLARPWLAAHRGPVRALAHAPASSAPGPVPVASCGPDWRVRIWAPGSASGNSGTSGAASGGALELDVPGHCSATALAWGRPGALFAADARGALHVWDLPRNRRPASSPATGEPFSALALHHSLLLAGDLAGAVHLVRPPESFLPGAASDDAAARALASALDEAT